MFVRTEFEIELADLDFFLMEIKLTAEGAINFFYACNSLEIAIIRTKFDLISKIKLALLLILDYYKI